MDNVLDQETFDFIYNNMILLLNIKIADEHSTEDEQKEYERTKSLLTYFINKVCTEITIRTNRYKFPNDLKYLAIDLVSDLYSLFNSDTGDVGSQQAIQSMSETGRSVSFGISDNAKTKYDLILTKKLEEQKDLIYKYKLLYKVRCPYAED